MSLPPELAKDDRVISAITRVSERVETLIDCIRLLVQEMFLERRELREATRARASTHTETTIVPTVLPDPDTPKAGLDVLGLSPRGRKALSRLGIATVGELCQKTANELLEVRNFGRVTLEEIRSRLRWFGLRLTGDAVDGPARG